MLKVSDNPLTLASLFSWLAAFALTWRLLTNLVEAAMEATGEDSRTKEVRIIGTQCVLVCLLCCLI